ncbi:MAG: sulfite reductase flavoprotein subunit alpha [Pseudomonadota bacterium]
MNILFGSVTGTAENLARDAARLAQERGHAVNLSELDEITMEDLCEMDDVLVVISTYGEGEMPFNAEVFWDEIEANKPVLEGLTYGVLALGDTAYEQFCQAGKEIDARFEELGAVRRIDRVDCDLNYEKDAANWIDRAIPKGEDAPATVSDAAVEPATKSWSRANPYHAKILQNRLLSGHGSSKEIRHLALDIADSGLSYEAGDCIAVVPRNPPELVEEMLARLQATADDLVDGYDLPLGELLSTKFEISTPHEHFVRAVSSVIADEDLKDACRGGREDLEDYLFGMDIIDVLDVDPRLQVDAETLLSLLQPLQHRAYSIASSPKAYEEEIHLTVAALRWSYNKRVHTGVCSTHLADRMTAGSDVAMFMVPNKRFRVPEDPKTPMIMVGPGTGIAPFLGFLQERKATGAAGHNWLFFGDRNAAHDDVYRDELTAFERDGYLHRLDKAFSRDQKDKVYVQDRMKAASAEVYRQLENGAHFYLCGDAKNMAPDVERALREIIAEQSGRSAEDAERYVSDMRREGRYLKDVY